MEEVKNKLDKELECCVCHDEYTDPRALPCAHSFCLECLQRCREFNGDIVCPLCRKCYRANPLDLPKAIGIHDVGVLRDIRQSALDEKRTNEGENKEMCPDHPDEELKTVCVPCQKVVCYQCLAVKHMGHAHQTVTELYDKKKYKIDIRLNQLQENIDQLETVSVQLLTMEETVNRAGGAMKQEIDTRADDIITRVTNRRHELKAMVDKEVEGKMMAIKQRRDTVRQHSIEVMATKQQIVEHLEKWNKAKVIANGQQLMDMAQDTRTPGLVKEADKTRPELDISFKVQDPETKILLGHIVHKSRDSNVIKMLQLCKRYLPTRELSKLLIVLAVFVVAVIMYHYSPLLGLIIMAFITVYHTVEYNHTDRSVRVNKQLIHDIPEIETKMPERLKVLAVVTGAITGIPLFYFLPWLYYIACIIGLLFGLYLTLQDFIKYASINIPPTVSNYLKIFLAFIGTIVMVILHFYQPWLSLCGIVLICITTIGAIHRSVKSVELFFYWMIRLVSVIVIFGILISEMLSVLMIFGCFQFFHKKIL